MIGSYFTNLFFNPTKRDTQGRYCSTLHVFLILPSICANLSLLQTQKVSRLMQEGNIDYLFTQPANQNDTRVLCDEDSMHN